MNIGVVVGRFQTAFLTDGHKAVLKRAYDENEALIIFIAEETVPFSIESPLPYDVREGMLKEQLRLYGMGKLVQFYKLPDFKYASTISHVIDQVLIHKHGGTVNEFTLYFGPTAFLADRYNGIAKVKVIDHVLTQTSSVRIRRSAYDMDAFNVSHHMGMIHAVGNRVPTPHLFICHIILHGMVDTNQGLLGLKKSEMKKLTLPLDEVSGVHNSPTDQAKDWIKKKFPQGVSGDTRLINALKIDDWRFRNSEDFAIYLVYLTRLFGATDIPEEFEKKLMPFEPTDWESEFLPIIPIVIRQSIS